MMILHISKRRIAVMAVSFMVIAAVTVVLAGCFSDKENTITLADTAEMADYLQQLGWQVEPDPIETLDLQLPQTLGDTWGDYAAMQTEQGLPFADFAGQPIRRYTFRITNYPGMDGVCRPTCTCAVIRLSAGTLWPPGRAASSTD